MTDETLAEIKEWALDWNPLYEGVTVENCCRAREAILQLVEDRQETAETMEPAKLTHWRVVASNGGILYVANSRDDDRWGITKANEWLEKMQGYGKNVHLEVWEQTWKSTPSEWQRVDVPAEARL